MEASHSPIMIHALSSFIIYLNILSNLININSINSIYKGKCGRIAISNCMHICLWQKVLKNNVNLPSRWLDRIHYKQRRGILMVDWWYDMQLSKEYILQPFIYLTSLRIAFMLDNKYRGLFLAYWSTLMTITESIDSFWEIIFIKVSLLNYYLINCIIYE